MKTAIRNKLSSFNIVALITLTAFSVPLMAGGHGEAKHSSDKSMASAMKHEVSDAWLNGKLDTTLLLNTHLDSFDIDTRVESGTAYLSGQVESGIESDLAHELALSIDGIDAVENDLKVTESAAKNASNSDKYQTRSKWREQVSNATLVATVKSKLLLNEHTSGLAINVDATNGVVTLSGEVDSEKESELAEKIAANVDDTRKVKNRLTVDSSAAS